MASSLFLTGKSAAHHLRFSSFRRHSVRPWYEGGDNFTKANVFAAISTVPNSENGYFRKDLKRMAVLKSRCCSSQYPISCLATQKRVRSYLSSGVRHFASTAIECYTPPFQKILIANRGEIALRIIKTCHLLNIETVAIHSTIDSRAPHVLAATHSICVGNNSSSDSYLNMDAICQAIQNSGAQAVHPGYGFLSENAEFARRIQQDLGVVFIGPDYEAIQAMGDKITSKRIAKSASVSTIPGYDGILTSADEAVQIVKDIGYPVMIKATSGGGGKGMRICRNESDLREGFYLSKAEAKSFFGDERLFLEKFVECPRHIEIQVLSGRKKSAPKSANSFVNPFPIFGDFGDDNDSEEELEILCFVERECSIQRRNQKIIEESPSPLPLSPSTRAAMVRQVKSLVRKVNYTSAGTVEFLVDANENFYFLEMNTRLQVEHAVTEMVSGNKVDLVRGMIEIAGGRGIPPEYLALLEGYDVDDDERSGKEDKEGRVVPFKGHAIEARIYAEDPLRGFLPSTGPLVQYIEPTARPAVDETLQSSDECQIRIDSGVVEGSLISQYYDPMISKLIAYSPNSRDEAIACLRDALDRYVVRGVGHNALFALDVLRHDEFMKGNTPTNFIEMQYPNGFEGVMLKAKELGELAAIAALVDGERKRVLSRPPRCDATKNKNRADGGEDVVVCLGGMFGNAYSVRIMDEERRKLVVKRLTKLRKQENELELDSEFELEPDNDAQIVVIDYIYYDCCHPVVDVRLNGGSNRAVQVQGEDSKTGLFNIRMFGADTNVLVMSPTEFELTHYMKEPVAVDTTDYILSPMPGTLISYAVQDGDEVSQGQEICIVEAMKMQNVLRSTRAGVIGKCHVKIGSSVRADEIIVELESKKADGTTA